MADSSTAKFDVANATSNAYEIKLDASGTGVLEFDFVDAGDTVTLSLEVNVGFNLKSRWYFNATNADLTGITRVEVASAKISLAQIKNTPSQLCYGEITVQVTGRGNRTSCVTDLSGYGNGFCRYPIKLVLLRQRQ